MRHDTALIVIDMQVAMLEGDWPVVGAEALLARLAGLCERARSAGVPVFFVRHGEGAGEPLAVGTPGWEVHSGLGVWPDDPHFDKTTPDAFASSPLADELGRRGIEHLIIAGVESGMCIRATTLGALDRGLRVTLITDGHSTYDTKQRTAGQIAQSVNDELADRVALVAAEDVAFNAP